MSEDEGPAADELLVEAARLRRSALADAERIVEQARAESNRLIEEARQRADDIVAQARAEAHENPPAEVEDARPLGWLFRSRQE